ncbi:hypothetical protein CHELA1G11_20433 [Hyphomicrobiales bacterium]|nr:hypothetical protein CHELA1G11_20433 [Hyphomicrobiales bacterium]CAH1690190.1 hypothetical protein CHELA1G2_20746 [Hyphomicrobiales bacterium]
MRRSIYAWTLIAMRAVREWIAAVGARTAFIEPASPWENGYCESFYPKLRDELLDRDIPTASRKRTKSSRVGRHYKHQAPAHLARLQATEAGSYDPAAKHSRKADHTLDWLGPLKWGGAAAAASVCAGCVGRSAAGGLCRAIEDNRISKHLGLKKPLERDSSQSFRRR